MDFFFLQLYHGGSIHHYMSQFWAVWYDVQHAAGM